MSQLLRVQCFTVSQDGFGAGEGQSLERPFGHIDPAELVSWPGPPRAGRAGPSPAAAGAWTTTWSATTTGTSGPRSWGGTSSARSAAPGRTTSGRAGGGETPPFRTPVFVLTHHVRPSFTLADTTFHFLDAEPAEALARAKEAAGGKDVRLGGGVSVIRAFLEADLVDTMHIAVAPIELGRGERLWKDSTELLDRFHLDTVPSPSGVTHLLFWRR
ncbi:dihydrofolate reductase [Nocardiopsis composta]|uniref:Dihydrofolate reductase n=1 Tax=Nocardiopsis composta TaxID=157465 RepID=A0A7W8QP47_9ACTN|nr:dihydrofolate reductase [Nocardiopsis composta]